MTREQNLKKRQHHFIVRLKQKEIETGEHIKPLTSYKNIHAPMKFKCLDCGLIFECSYTTLFERRYLCPNKSKAMKDKGYHRNMRKVFHQRFLKKQKQTGEHIKQLTPYISYAHKIKFKCLDCGLVFWEFPSDIYESKHICPNKYRKIGNSGHKKTTKQFKQEVYDQVGNEYIVLSEYKSTHSPILMEHHSKKCKYYKKYHKYFKFWVEPDSFINFHHRCTYDFMTPRKTTAQFSKEVYDTTNGEFRLKSKYGKTNQDKVLIEHHSKDCPYYKKYHKYFCWWTTPNEFLKYLTCPYGKKTEGEWRSSCWLKKHGLVQSKSNDRLTQGSNYIYGYICKLHPFTDGKPHFDFYFPNLKYNKYFTNGIAIEFDGGQHFYKVPFGKMPIWQLVLKTQDIKCRDDFKNIYCLDNHIKMIRIKNKKSLKGKSLQKLVNHVLDKELLPILSHGPKSTYRNII